LSQEKKKILTLQRRSHPRALLSGSIQEDLRWSEMIGFLKGIDKLEMEDKLTEVSVANSGCSIAISSSLHAETHI